VWFSRSLRIRLTLWYIVLLAIILAIFSLGIYLTLRENLNSNFNQSMQIRVADLLVAVTYESSVPTLPARGSSSGLDKDDQFVRIYDSSGRLSFDTSEKPLIVPVDRASVQQGLAGKTDVRGETIGEDPFRVRVVPIRRDGVVVGALEVGRAADGVVDTLRTLSVVLAVAYPLTLLVASFGGLFLAGRALAPIDRLTRQARSITAEDLSRRLDMQLPDDELGRLSRTFDDMIARLDDAFRRQRQFTADASHELRTPLTAIKGQVEVSLSRPRPSVDYRKVLDAVNSEVDRMIRLVASLLMLARADSGHTPIAQDAVSLSDIAGGAVDGLQPVANEHDIEIRVESAPAVWVQGDKDLLLQLLLNLLDNAVKHTGEGGDVTIGWGTSGNRVRLYVRDTGVGMAPEHLPRIFDRFYRIDTARSRSAGGVGLGLSICRWIAEAHGGSLSVESSPGQGSTFTLSLPC